MISSQPQYMEHYGRVGLKGHILLLASVHLAALHHGYKANLLQP